MHDRVSPFLTRETGEGMALVAFIAGILLALYFLRKDDE